MEKCHGHYDFPQNHFPYAGRRIIVMDKGEIQQMGTHDQLIQQDGPYKDIYEIQMNSAIRLMEGGAVCE